ncbi:F-box only protein 36b [Synchiropus splendidus]|uniref:F-box only protein 36b n=1 Tax=Synchiropus splendidus TaxID=270530 RepID=UPI00237EBABC|nr:F-box only protein 36b [Synchiropus splendidus]
MASMLPDPLLEIAGPGVAPDKNFYCLTVSMTEVIWRWWKISPRVIDRMARPGEMKENHEDFLLDMPLHNLIQKIFGSGILLYVKGLCEGSYGYINHLSDELILRILSYLELEDIAQFAVTSRKFRRICMSEEFWELVARQRCSTLPLDVETLAGEVGWRSIFFANKVELQKMIRRSREMKEQEANKEKEESKLEVSSSSSSDSNP